MIPKSFKIAGGKTINIKIVSHLDDSEFGNFNYTTNTISIAESVNGTKISEEDMERTYYHELIHVFQWFYNVEFDEAQAQVYSNFIYEYINSCQN